MYAVYLPGAVDNYTTLNEKLAVELGTHSGNQNA